MDEEIYFSQADCVPPIDHNQNSDENTEVLHAIVNASDSTPNESSSRTDVHEACHSINGETYTYTSFSTTKERTKNCSFHNINGLDFCENSSQKKRAWHSGYDDSNISTTKKSRISIEPDDQGKSKLCVVFSLCKAITRFMENCQIFFEQKDVLTALMQIFKNVKGCKDPKKDFDGQSIQLRDVKMDEYWLITINVEEMEFQKHFQNIKENIREEEFLLGIEDEKISFQYCGVYGPHCAS